MPTKELQLECLNNWPGKNLGKTGLSTQDVFPLSMNLVPIASLQEGCKIISNANFRLMPSAYILIPKVSLTFLVNKTGQGNPKGVLEWEKNQMRMSLSPHMGNI